MTCGDAALVGGHYHDAGVADPWDTTYTADMNGVAIGSFTVETSIAFGDQNGHAVVVHLDGTRLPFVR